MKQITPILFSGLLIVVSAPAGDPSASFSVNRIRMADEVEVREVRIGIQFDLTDLASGESSVARLSVPGISLEKVVPVTVRGSRGIFSFKAPFEDVLDLNGEWRVVINSGETANEDLSFVMSGFSESDLPDFPEYPQLEYQSRYDQVFIPARSTLGTGASASASPGHTDLQPVTNGFVYTFPDGGPYYATAGRSRDLPGFPVLNREQEVVMMAEHPTATSARRIDFFISPEPLEFGLTMEIGQESGRLYCRGLTKGLTYQLIESNNLTGWSLVTTFTSQSNAFLHEFDLQSDRRFYKMLRE